MRTRSSPPLLPSGRRQRLARRSSDADIVTGAAPGRENLTNRPATPETSNRRLGAGNASREARTVGEPVTGISSHSTVAALGETASMVTGRAGVGKIDADRHTADTR